MPHVSLEVPQEAATVLNLLERAGHEAWIVGGWVRDSLLGLPDHDVDIATSAHWRQVRSVCASHGIQTHETGTAHGTLTCVVEGIPIEVTTYRIEGAYSDARHPDAVEFVDSIDRDLARRDLTINAMAYHPARGLFDPFDGEHDLRQGIIRCVGNPHERFEEDALRVLRTVRFACRLGFTVHAGTQQALVETADRLAHIAQERIGAELSAILASGRGAWALQHETDVIVAAVPELAPSVGFDQHSRYHPFDVLEHTARVMQAVEACCGGVVAPELAWAAFLHDIGKPSCYVLGPDGRGHFFGHPETSAEIAFNIMHRFAIPLSVIKATCALICYHDRVIHAHPASLRRMLFNLEEACPGRAVPLCYMLLDLKRSDALGKAPWCMDYAYALDAIEELLRREAREHVHRRLHAGEKQSASSVAHASGVWRMSDLAINGADVMEACHLEPGVEVGRILRHVLSAVISETLPNDRQEILEALRSGTR